MTTYLRPKGIHAGVDEAAYHGDPALSQSALKLLLESPAKYDWRRTHPEPPKTVFDVGSAAHTLILGVGDEIAVVDAKDWRTKAAQQAQAEAYAAGRIPLLRHQFDAVYAMAEAVLAHRTARAWLEAEGDAELSAWWTDEASDGTPIQCRSRMDKLTTDSEGQPTIVDLKTTGKSASAAAFARSVIDYGYDIQDDQYCDGFEILTGQRPRFIFIVVEKDPPHLPAVHTLDDLFKARGRRRRRQALDLWAVCTRAGQWPGHGEDLHVLTPPAWAS